MIHSKDFVSVLFILLFTFGVSYAQVNKYRIRTVAFYNVENLFDTIDDSAILDDDYTPEGKNNYTAANYYHKIENIAAVINRIGTDIAKSGPVIIGLAEIENLTVLEDLVKSDQIKNQQYQIIHYDSPDRRGIDVALIYKEALFNPIHHEKIELKIWDENGTRIFTRDLLWVSGIMDNEVIHFIINHWPSRRGGRSRSEPKRMKAAYMVRQIISKICQEYPEAKIIIMGDFNDDPINKSIKEGIMESLDSSKTNDDHFFNPMEKMFKKGLNTLAYRDGLNLFDQMILSKNLLRTQKPIGDLTFFKAGIYNPEMLTTQTGKYKGYPYRSFENNKYVGGYSDHYPVYICLIKAF
jgi:hypothetical protein